MNAPNKLNNCTTVDNSTSSNDYYNYRGRRTRRKHRRDGTHNNNSIILTESSTTTTTTTIPASIVTSVRGVHGVRLKHFESVVAALLPTLRPVFVTLPPFPTNCRFSQTTEITNFWDLLPSAARCGGNLPGQLVVPSRAKRKEEQVQSMIHCIEALMKNDQWDTEMQLQSTQKEQKIYTIVDFGGGSGHLSIPLALLFPMCRIVCVDLGERSLQLLHQKVTQCGISHDKHTAIQNETSSTSTTEPQIRSAQIQATAAIPNLYTFHGAADTYPDTFDIAVALHLCGEATDVVLRMAGQQQAMVVAAPCCVGKLSGRSRNPYIFVATGQNKPTIHYPQSQQFETVLGVTNTMEYDWNALAQAADYSDTMECRSSRNAARRTAKALLETDRRLFLEETYAYRTALTRMEPWEATPKNDILLAWHPRREGQAAFLDTLPIDTDCEADIQKTIDHLLGNPLNETNTLGLADEDGNDWTRKEEHDVRLQLEAFLVSDERKMVFPTGMGGRKRKLVHYVAEHMNLAHWCEGSKRSEKTVAVARRQSHKEKNEAVKQSVAI